MAKGKLPKTRIQTLELLAPGFRLPPLEAFFAFVHSEGTGLKSPGSSMATQAQLQWSGLVGPGQVLGMCTH